MLTVSDDEGGVVVVPGNPKGDKRELNIRYRNELFNTDANMLPVTPELYQQIFDGNSPARKRKGTPFFIKRRFGLNKKNDNDMSINVVTESKKDIVSSSSQPNSDPFEMPTFLAGQTVLAYLEDVTDALDNWKKENSAGDENDAKVMVEVINVLREKRKLSYKMNKYYALIGDDTDFEQFKTKLIQMQNLYVESYASLRNPIFMNEEPFSLFLDSLLSNIKATVSEHVLDIYIIKKIEEALVYMPELLTTFKLALEIGGKQDELKIDWNEVGIFMDRMSQGVQPSGRGGKRRVNLVQSNGNDMKMMNNNDMNDVTNIKRQLDNFAISVKDSIKEQDSKFSRCLDSLESLTKVVAELNSQPTSGYNLNMTQRMPFSEYRKTEGYFKKLISGPEWSRDVGLRDQWEKVNKKIDMYQFFCGICLRSHRTSEHPYNLRGGNGPKFDKKMVPDDQDKHALSLYYDYLKRINLKN